MRRAAPGIGTATALLALALGCGAFFAHAQNPGLWRDDYTWGVRDPASGMWSWAAIASLPGSWRPLSVLTVRTVLTVQGDQAWIGRVIAAAAHGFAAWQLWILMRELNISLRAAAVATLLFVFMPWAFEVGLWPAAAPTAIAAGLWLWLAAIAARMADGRLGPRWAGATGALALAIPCWNEQSATAVVAIPLLYLAAGRRGEHAASRLKRSAPATALCCAVCGFYVAVLALTSRPELRGGAGSYTPASMLLARTWEVAGRAGDLVAGATARDMVLGSIRLGASQLWCLAGVGWLLVAVIGSCVWLRSWNAAPSQRPDRPGLVACFGIAVFLLGWAPVVIIQKAWVEPRLAYAPLAGLLIAGAALASGWTAPRAGPLRWAISLAAPAALALLAIGMLGFATLIRDRARMDLAEAKALVRLNPNPPAGSVFVAVRAEAAAARTGWAGFDRLEQSAWSWDLYGTCLLRRVYARDDLYFVRFWPGGEGAAATEQGLRVSPIERPAYERPRLPERIVPWNQAILFRIDPVGRVFAMDPDELRARPGEPADQSGRGPPGRP